MAAAVPTAGFAVYVIFVKPAISKAETSAKRFAKQAELTQMQDAIESYKTKNGEYPPNATAPEINRHLKAVFGSEHDLDSLQEKTSLDFSNLDERESIWFWLNGHSTRMILGDRVRGLMYDCRPKHFTDIDNVGLMEYTSADGEYFVIRDGKALLLDPVTNQAKSAVEFEN